MFQSKGTIPGHELTIAEQTLFGQSLVLTPLGIHWKGSIQDGIFPLQETYYSLYMNPSISNTNSFFFSMSNGSSWSSPHVNAGTAK